MENEIICDTSFFVPLFLSKDTSHEKADLIFSELLKLKPQFVINNYVVAELLTVVLVRTQHIEKITLLEKSIFHQYKKILKIYQTS